MSARKNGAAKPAGQSRRTGARARAAKTSGGVPAPYVNRAQVRGLFGPPSEGGDAASGGGLLASLGGLDGILSIMGKVQKMFSLFKAMMPMFRLFGTFMGGGKAATASVRKRTVRSKRQLQVSARTPQARRRK
ncbi:hypothetical protein [Paenibacillus ginsengihumi]|mgnify:CR=1 FL=1|uniref:hypothetical protein n=1 Tax=Paenibacillus ginsengihumi TaxID=431596 RepID=UPI0003725A3C|nr:hypothetical protein [Paenibacillus ginsengihumi]